MSRACWGVLSRAHGKFGELRPGSSRWLVGRLAGGCAHVQAGAGSLVCCRAAVLRLLHCEDKFVPLYFHQRRQARDDDGNSVHW